jgi:hypothetical protein
MEEMGIVPCRLEPAGWVSVQIREENASEGIQRTFRLEALVAAGRVKRSTVRVGGVVSRVTVKGTRTVTGFPEESDTVMLSLSFAPSFRVTVWVWDFPSTV